MNTGNQWFAVACGIAGLIALPALAQGPAAASPAGAAPANVRPPMTPSSPAA